MAVAGAAGDGHGVVVETVKASDDRRGDVVVRLYGSLGAHTKAALVAGFALAEVRETDLLERPAASASGAVGERHGDRVELRLRPFQILTLRLTPAD